MQYATQVLNFSAVRYRPIKRQIQESFGLLSIRLIEPWCPYSLKLKVVGHRESTQDSWEPYREGQHRDIIAEAIIPARRIQDSIVLLGQGTSLWLHRNHIAVALVAGHDLEACLMQDGSIRMTGDRHLYRVLCPKVLGIQTLPLAKDSGSIEDLGAAEDISIEERFREQQDREAIAV